MLQQAQSAAADAPTKSKPLCSSECRAANAFGAQRARMQRPTKPDTEPRSALTKTNTESTIVKRQRAQSAAADALTRPK
jgi:hypothetical protein